MRPLNLIPLTHKRVADAQPRLLFGLSPNPEVKARDCVAANDPRYVRQTRSAPGASLFSRQMARPLAPRDNAVRPNTGPASRRRHQASAAGVPHPSEHVPITRSVTEAPTGVCSVTLSSSIRNERMSHRRNRIAAVIAPTVMLAVFTAHPALADESDGQGAVTSPSTQSAVTGSVSSQDAVTAAVPAGTPDIPVVSDAIELTSATTTIGSQEGTAAGARAAAATPSIAPAVTGGVVGGAAGCAIGGFAGALAGAVIAPDGGALPGAAIGCAVGAVGGAVAGSEIAQSQADQSATA